MKDWVSHLKAAIEKIHKTRVSVPDMQEVMETPVLNMEEVKGKLVPELIYVGKDKNMFLIGKGKICSC